MGFIISLLLLQSQTLIEGQRYDAALPSAVGLTQLLPRDPWAWYARAVCEHQCLMYDECTRSIERARYHADVREFPSRYVAVLTMMERDIANVQRGLDMISRKMARVSRRLDDSMGGPETQRQQREILKDLEALIKAKEDAAAKAITAAEILPADAPTPLPDSTIPTAVYGPGVADKRIADLRESWGKLEPAARAKALQAITRDYPPRYRPIIEAYFKAINKDR